MSDKPKPEPVPPFWRKQPLSPAEVRLIGAVCSAHARCVGQPSCSTATVVNTYHGSGDYHKAIAAGILTMGDEGWHAPVGRVMRFLRRVDYEEEARKILAAGKRAPGWGHDFVQGQRDPNWADVDKVLAAGHKKWWDRLNIVETLLHEAGKKVYVNPAGYTAAAALALDFPSRAAAYFVIAGRLAAWTHLVVQQPTPWGASARPQSKKVTDKGKE